jgi:hypothetical protein
MPGHALPDDIPEVGYITIQLGLDKDGIVPGYDYDGITPEMAIGYLTAFADMLREDLRTWHVINIIDDDEDDDEDSE